MNENVLNTFPRLVAEIGEAQLNLAVIAQPNRKPECARSVQTAGYGSLQDAVADYLHHLDPLQARPRWGAIGLPCPLPHRPDRTIHVPECGWSLSLDKARDELGLERLLLLESFAALCMAVPSLCGDQLTQMGGQAAAEREPMAVIELGRGLRTAILLPWHAGHAALQGHGGQLEIAPRTAEEASIARWCEQRCGQASADCILNARGLEVLHQALCELRSIGREPCCTTEIVQRAHAGSDSLCVDAVATFCAMLGTLAGNLALTLGASGGVYVAGLPSELAATMQPSAVRPRFDDRGRLSRHACVMPLYLVRESACTLLGASAALDSPPSFGVLESASPAWARRTLALLATDDPRAVLRASTGGILPSSTFETAAKGI